MDEKVKISKPKEFEIKYSKPSDFKSYFATGVTGGSTVNGLINMNFFVDTVKLPEMATRKIQEGIIMPEELSKINMFGSNRELLVGILIDLNTAKLIEKWIREVIELREDQDKKVAGLRK